MTILNDLYTAKGILEKLAQDLRDAPEKRLIADLLTALEKIDKSFTEEFEDELNDGETMLMRSFYIEADDWLDVHSCLRRLADGETDE